MEKSITVVVMIIIAFFAYSRANKSKEARQNTMRWIWVALALLASIVATISLIGLLI
jgi:hypothetical protein